MRPIITSTRGRSVLGIAYNRKHLGLAIVEGQRLLAFRASRLRGRRSDVERAQHAVHLLAALLGTADPSLVVLEAKANSVAKPQGRDLIGRALRRACELYELPFVNLAISEARRRLCNRIGHVFTREARRRLIDLYPSLAQHDLPQASSDADEARRTAMRPDKAAYWSKAFAAATLARAVCNMADDHSRQSNTPTVCSTDALCAANPAS